MIHQRGGSYPQYGERGMPSMGWQTGEPEYGGRDELPVPGDEATSVTMSAARGGVAGEGGVRVPPGDEGGGGTPISRGR